MAHTSIEWTESTWNPLTGCTKISPGCRFCYAERMAARLRAMGQPRYANGFKVTLHEDILELPLTWKKPQRIFVNSMSDMFHEDVPARFIKETFDVMRRAWWHQFQVLTKRSNILLDIGSTVEWTDNVWMGVSVERQEYTFRIDDLRNTGATLKFVSFEPLLGPIPDLNLHGVDWVIVGGESGPGARPVVQDWVLEIKERCSQAHVPFFFKQWGGVNKKKAGRLLQGRTWDELPSPDNHPDRLSGPGSPVAGAGGVPTVIPTKCRDTGRCAPGKGESRRRPRRNGGIRVGDASGGEP